VTRRLERDNRRREVLRLPCPKFVPAKEESEEKDERSSAKKDEGAAKERRGYYGRHSPRRSPPR